MYLSQKENEIEQLKRTLDESNRFKDLKIEELEEKVANLAVENERLRNMLLMKG